MKNSKAKGTKIWIAKIAPYRKFARMHKGFMPEVLRQAERLHPGIEWSRAHVHYWLNPKEGNAGEPNFGNGTILLQACAAAKVATELGAAAS